MFPVAASIKRLVTRSLASKWILLPVAGVVLSLPAVAHADSRFDGGRYDRNSRWSDRRDYDRRDYNRGRSGTNIDVDIRIGGRDRRPEYREREVRVWVPASYRTVVDRKWVEPVYRVECERVWVPAQYEEREVVHYERGRRCTHVERVQVCDGHFESRERRVCVSEGHWETCERQELVCAGHYETHVERVKVPYRVDPLVVVNPGLGGAWGR